MVSLEAIRGASRQGASARGNRSAMNRRHDIVVRPNQEIATTVRRREHHLGENSAKAPI